MEHDRFCVRAPGAEAARAHRSWTSTCFTAGVGAARLCACDYRSLGRGGSLFRRDLDQFSSAISKGLGYEITRANVWAAYSNTIKAAERLDRRDEVRDRVRATFANNRFVAQVLGRELGLTTL